MCLLVKFTRGAGHDLIMGIPARAPQGRRAGRRRRAGPRPDPRASRSPLRRVRSQQSASTHRMSCSSTEAPSLETGAMQNRSRSSEPRPCSAAVHPAPDRDNKRHADRGIGRRQPRAARTGPLDGDRDGRCRASQARKAAPAVCQLRTDPPARPRTRKERQRPRRVAARRRRSPALPQWLAWHAAPLAEPNAFVERFQGSVLRLHYRTAFRYRFYQNVDDIDGDLQGWLRYYNSSMPRGAWIDPGIKRCARPRRARGCR